jgi:hypothetical protein
MVHRRGRCPVARTGGGLTKKNFQFTDVQVERIATVARERDLKEAAAVRELLDLGWKVYQLRKQYAGPVEDLAAQVVAREVD